MALGEARIRGVDTVELAKLLCKRGEVERLAGDQAAVQTALSEAESIASQLGASPNSELGKAVAALRAALDSSRPETDTPAPKEPL